MSGLASRENSDMHVTGHMVNFVGGNLSVQNGPNYLSGLSIMTDNIALGAFHDSADQHTSGKCHQNTRVAVLKDLQEWIRSPDAKEPILWVYGPAGCGKSSIVRTFAQWCIDAKVLAASFFCSREFGQSPGRDEARRIIPTIVYQIIQHFPHIAEDALRVVERDPVIFSRSMDTQLDNLVMGPLHNAKTSGAVSQSSLVIIDGVDELRDRTEQKQLILSISLALRKLPVPLRFMISSRPEREIREGFKEASQFSIARQIGLGNGYKPDEDIRRFLESGFNEIKKNHHTAEFLDHWPPDSAIDYLVKKSSGQFFYAASVMRFISSQDHLPTERLQATCASSPESSTDLMPLFTELDKLYAHAFSSVKNMEETLKLLRFIILLPPSLKSPRILEEFALLPKGRARALLMDLHSIVYVPDVNGLPPETRGFKSLDSEKKKLCTRERDDSKNFFGRRDIYLHHGSVEDFLFDHGRSGHLYIDPKMAHLSMATHCSYWINPISESMIIDEFYEYGALNLARHWAACSKTPLFDELQGFVFSRWFLALQHVRLTSHEDIIYIASRTDDEKIGSNAIEEMSYLIAMQDNPTLSHHFSSNFDSWLADYLKTWTDEDLSVGSFFFTSLSLGGPASVARSEAVALLLCSPVLSFANFTAIDNAYDKPMPVEQFTSALQVTRLATGLFAVFPNETSLLGDFFCDEKRSGKLHVNQNDMAKLGKILITILQTRVLFLSMADSFLNHCLDTILLILKETTKDQDFCSFLQDNRLELDDNRDFSNIDTSLLDSQENLDFRFSIWEFGLDSVSRDAALVSKFRETEEAVEVYIKECYATYGLREADTKRISDSESYEMGDWVVVYQPPSTKGSDISVTETETLWKAGISRFISTFTG